MSWEGTTYQKNVLKNTNACIVCKKDAINSPANYIYCISHSHGHGPGAIYISVHSCSYFTFCMNMNTNKQCNDHSMTVMFIVTAGRGICNGLTSNNYDIIIISVMANIYPDVMSETF